MYLRRSIEFVRQLEKELSLFNIEPDDPLEERLATLFETQNVVFATEQTSSGKPAIAVLSNRNGVLAVLAVSTLRALTDHHGARAGTTGFADGEYEDILSHLKETTFTSYDIGQLLSASREIEDRARRVGDGTVHAGFQRVSVMHDQQTIYADLARRGIDVHAYGVPDTSPPALGNGTVHAVENDEIRQMWFVVFDGGGDESQKTALLAEEQAENSFYGAWTYDPGIVDSLCEYLEQKYVDSAADTRSSLRE